MALVPIFRPARFGLAQRWRPPKSAPPAAKPAPEPRPAPPSKATPSPHPAEPDDERTLTEEEKDALRERMATAVGAVPFCHRAACRRAGHCRGKSACLREHRQALQPALDHLNARLKARLAGETSVPEQEPEAAPGRRRPGGRRRKARRGAVKT